MFKKEDIIVDFENKRLEKLQEKNVKYY